MCLDGTAEWYSGSLGAQYVQPLGSMIGSLNLTLISPMTIIYTGDLDQLMCKKAMSSLTSYRPARRKLDVDALRPKHYRRAKIASGAADVPLARGSHMSYYARGEVWGIQAVWEF